MTCTKRKLKSRGIFSRDTLVYKRLNVKDVSISIWPNDWKIREQRRHAVYFNDRVNSNASLNFFNPWKTNKSDFIQSVPSWPEERIFLMNLSTQLPLQFSSIIWSFYLPLYTQKPINQRLLINALAEQLKINLKFCSIHSSKTKYPGYARKNTLSSAA